MDPEEFRLWPFLCGQLGWLVAYAAASAAPLVLLTLTCWVVRAFSDWLAGR